MRQKNALQTVNDLSFREVLQSRGCFRVNCNDSSATVQNLIRVVLISLQVPEVRMLARKRRAMLPSHHYASSVCSTFPERRDSLVPKTLDATSAPWHARCE